MAKITPSKVISVLTQPKKKNKANLKTMIKLKERCGGMPTKLIDDQGNIDFEYIVAVYAILCQQDDPTITEEQVMESLDMENLPDALNLITQMILFEAPSKELQGNGIAPSDENNSQATSKTESDSPEGAEKN